ncbi:MAG: UDP-N-acetylmuramoyl-L-alanyl-D-glutamate--2,6-diaminopimelate ligase [Gammaproteobacteria bacterium]|nr:UDP-N-acetylmuramoyl-L-alanyl-D-glutamate--2,6-diaminopimelate ligase [Gammaproteobacteria bacterium]
MTKLLSFLLHDFSLCDSSIQIDNITNDSRAVSKNTLFLAYPGIQSDGRKYIQQAIDRGAIAICYEPSDDFILPNIKIPAIAVPNLKVVQSSIAAQFYEFPSTKVPIIGVTGTNGKTSITHFIAQILENCAVVGTVGYGFLSNLHKTINTTPDGVQLQNNLTQDHLDYHITMEKYRDAKELLFQQPGLKNAVINIDDAAGKYYAEKYHNKLNVITYSMRDKNASIYVEKCTPTEHGFDLKIKTPSGNGEFNLPLIGEFNIYNVLAVIGVLMSVNNQCVVETRVESCAATRNKRSAVQTEQNIVITKILEKLSHLHTVPGRMELVKSNPSIIIDYAHTPDALEKVLQSVRIHCSGKLICVFGCGGDRDKTKRPIMGAIAEKLSDYVIITNDNPRSEDPKIIAKEILNGMTEKNHFLLVLDRAIAIKKAIQCADKNDWIVIAGKGHETEQIIGDQVLHHSDAESVKSALATSTK